MGSNCPILWEVAARDGGGALRLLISSLPQPPLSPCPLLLSLPPSLNQSSPIPCALFLLPRSSRFRARSLSLTTAPSPVAPSGPRLPTSLSCLLSRSSHFQVCALPHKFSLPPCSRTGSGEQQDASSASADGGPAVTAPIPLCPGAMSSLLLSGGAARPLQLSKRRGDIPWSRRAGMVDVRWTADRSEPTTIPYERRS